MIHRIESDDIGQLEEVRQCQAMMWSWFYTRRCEYSTMKEWRGYALCGVHRRPGVVVTEEY